MSSNKVSRWKEKSLSLKVWKWKGESECVKVKGESLVRVNGQKRKNESVKMWRWKSEMLKWKWKGERTFLDPNLTQLKLISNWAYPATCVSSKCQAFASLLNSLSRRVFLDLQCAILSNVQHYTKCKIIRFFFNWGPPKKFFFFSVSKFWHFFMGFTM